jgi:hypoxanthine phosphoribosyltransferase
MQRVTLHDKHFVEYIEEKQIIEVTHNLGLQLSKDFEGKRPIFVVVLNGSFLFAADLFRYYKHDAEIIFTRVSSYEGTSSSGKVKEVMPIADDLNGRDIVVVEDIVDTGLTIETLVKSLQSKGAKSVKVATMLFKPDAYTKDIPIDYIGFRVGNDFLVGYGLDYNSLGRNLRSIYKLSDI